MFAVNGDKVDRCPHICDLRSDYGSGVNRRLIRLLQISASQVERAASIVLGLYRLAILVDGPVALAGGIEDIPQFKIAPDLGPFRNTVSMQRVAKCARRRLIIPLPEIQFAQPIAGQGTDVVDCKRLAILLESLPQNLFPRPSADRAEYAHEPAYPDRSSAASDPDRAKSFAARLRC